MTVTVTHMASWATGRKWTRVPNGNKVSELLQHLDGTGRARTCPVPTSSVEDVVNTFNLFLSGCKYPFPPEP